MHPHSVVGAAVIAAFTLLLARNGITPANAQACAAGSAQEISGNWYCSEVNAISYTNFPGTGYYSKVTDMDEVCVFSCHISPLRQCSGVHAT